MDCKFCENYLRKQNSCKLGMVNPPTLRATILGIQVLGINAICSKAGMKMNAMKELENSWRK